MTKDEELKPCPFCGVNDKTLFVSEYQQNRFEIQCFVCGARGPCGVATRVQAIREWNMRVEEIVARTAVREIARHFGITDVRLEE